MLANTRSVLNCMRAIAFEPPSGRFLISYTRYAVINSTLTKILCYLIMTLKQLKIKYFEKIE